MEKHEAAAALLQQAADPAWRVDSKLESTRERDCYRYRRKVIRTIYMYTYVLFDSLMVYHVSIILKFDSLHGLF